MLVIFRNQFLAYLNDKKDNNAQLEQLFTELQNYSSETTHSMRSLLDRCGRLRSNYVVPVQETLLSAHERKQEQVC